MFPRRLRRISGAIRCCGQNCSRFRPSPPCSWYRPDAQPLTFSQAAFKTQTVSRKGVNPNLSRPAPPAFLPTCSKHSQHSASPACRLSLPYAHNESMLALSTSRWPALLCPGWALQAGKKKFFRGFCLIFAHNSFGINKTLSKPRTKKNQKEPKRAEVGHLASLPAKVNRGSNIFTTVPL